MNLFTLPKREKIYGHLKKVHIPMEETFYHILAKQRLTEKDKKKLSKMYTRLLREQELLKAVFTSISL